jgi:hypothetical protein
MKLWALFCSVEFCILKVILHKTATSSFEDRGWKCSRTMHYEEVSEIENKGILMKRKG